MSLNLGMWVKLNVIKGYLLLLVNKELNNLNKQKKTWMKGFAGMCETLLTHRLVFSYLTVYPLPSSSVVPQGMFSDPLSHYHTARERRQVRPTKYQVSLSVSSCLETSSCARRGRAWKLKFVFDVFLRSISHFLPNA